MPGLLKDIRLEVKVRNNLLLTAMEQKGITSIKELCRQMEKPGIYGSVIALASMKVSARKQNDEWLPVVHQLAEFFQCMPEDLFSEPQQYRKLEKNRAHAEVTFAEVQSLTSRRQEPVTPELAMQARQLRLAISKALETLTPREERVLRMRFGFETGEEATLEAIGLEFNVGRERIRTIEAKALRKLKHPSRAKLLALAGGGLRKVKSSSGDYESYCVDEDVKEAL